LEEEDGSVLIDDKKIKDIFFHLSIYEYDLSGNTMGRKVIILSASDQYIDYEVKSSEEDWMNAKYIKLEEVIGNAPKGIKLLIVLYRN